MHQLLLMRHAKSLWDDPTMTDHARPLNARGRQAAAAMGLAIRELGLLPDVVLVSSSRRTLQTLEALAPWAETPLVEPMDALYLATAPALLQIIASVAETVRSMLLIGHNPGMHDLAMALAGGEAGLAAAPQHRLREGFPTGALAEFTVTGPWTKINDPEGARATRLLRFLTPRDLPPLKPSGPAR
jgi:phosphohistidine phosphatase